MTVTWHPLLLSRQSVPCPHPRTTGLFASFPPRVAPCPVSLECSLSIAVSQHVQRHSPGGAGLGVVTPAGH